MGVEVQAVASKDLRRVRPAVASRTCNVKPGKTWAHRGHRSRPSRLLSRWLLRLTVRSGRRSAKRRRPEERQDRVTNKTSLMPANKRDQKTTITVPRAQGVSPGPGVAPLWVQGAHLVRGAAVMVVSTCRVFHSRRTSHCTLALPLLRVQGA